MKHLIKSKRFAVSFVFICLSLIFFLTSCKKKKPYNFRMKNDMEFDISGIQFGRMTSGFLDGLEKGKQSDIFVVDCRVGVTFMPKWMTIFFDELDSLQNIYSYVSLDAIPYKRSDLNKDLNIVRISNKVSSDTLYIEMKLN